MIFSCPGDVVTDSTTGALECQDGSGGVVMWQTSADFDPTQIDVPTATYYMSWGFFVIVMGWAVGFGIKKAVHFIRAI